MILLPEDEQMMLLALAEAEAAGRQGEVPVGALLVHEGRVIARAGNRVVATRDPAGHAEIRVLRRAAAKMDTYRLCGATLYVTLEPCPMCAGALVHARIDRLVFGAADPKGGGIVSKYAIGQDGRLNHCLAVTGGVLARRCGAILREFFQKRR